MGASHRSVLVLEGEGRGEGERFRLVAVEVTRLKTARSPLGCDWSESPDVVCYGAGAANWRSPLNFTGGGPGLRQLARGKNR